ncbi:Virus X resistance protein-like, coiled-coil domain [Sesbania bispinosa]|nr:Virus X resistance protein-like, coiled-coil domain [Sesbania bispinosa]
MAETAVSLVTDKLISLLSNEVKLLKDVHVQVGWVKDELLLIQAYLKDADEKAEMTERRDNTVKEWVKQLREVAFRIEDVMDVYLIKVSKRHKRHGVVGVLCKIGFFIKSVISRHDIMDEIDHIKGSIRRLNETRETLNLNQNSLEASTVGMSARVDLRMGAHYVEDAQLVGVDDIRESLTHFLLNGPSQRTIFSVVGEGGLGKTTIVKNIYNKQKEKKCFDCHAWITVSRSLKGDHLLKTILESFYEEDNNKSAVKEISETVMPKDNLIRKIREYLQAKSYVIVFYDIWEQDFWGDVEHALPTDNNGKIILTTRDRRVADFCKSCAPVFIHEMKPLPFENGLKLFHMKAFQFDPQCCPDDLMQLSKDFVEKCEGVPLAIVAIFGLLSTKNKIVSDWQKVYNSLRSKFSSDPHLKSFHKVLLESYYDLPYHLKSCLLYFGLFPEDYSIKCRRLTRLWVAEGFVKEDEINKDQTPKEVAEEYLGELIHRSLVKISDLYFDGRVRSCRVHDLMHAFITRKCEELNFCQVVENEEFRFHGLTRRLSIHKNIESVEDERAYGRVRSCFVSDMEEFSKSMVKLKSLLSSFKLLVALDFENSPLDYLPEPVGMLLNLKYLNLRNTNIKVIPKFIGNLQNLETIDLRDTQVRELPKEINKLVKLRHLLSYSVDSKRGLLDAWNWHGVKLNEGIECLTALQSLTKIDITDGNGVINELKNLKRMRRLGIIMRKVNGNEVCNAIKNMSHLCSLSIATAGDESDQVLELQSLTDPPPCIQRLYLDGRLDNLPLWIPKLKNLVRLRLAWSRLMEDPLPLLKSLSELVELRLYESYEGGEIHFQEGWFTKIKYLRLRHFSGLRTLRIYEKALPHLEELWLGPFPQMVQAPPDIQNLESLKHVFLFQMPRQIRDDILMQLKENATLHYFL